MGFRAAQNLYLISFDHQAEEEWSELLMGVRYNPDITRRSFLQHPI
jgi:hypothetical protein